MDCWRVTPTATTWYSESERDGPFIETGFCFVQKPVSVSQMDHVKLRFRGDRRQRKQTYGCLNYTVSQKKQDTKLLPITSPTVNRFSKLFH